MHAFILSRNAADDPAISEFERSLVWDPQERPRILQLTTKKLVLLHPPDTKLPKVRAARSGLFQMPAIIPFLALIFGYYIHLSWFNELYFT